MLLERMFKFNSCDESIHCRSLVLLLMAVASRSGWIYYVIKFFVLKETKESVMLTFSEAHLSKQRKISAQIRV